MCREMFIRFLAKGLDEKINTALYSYFFKKKLT